MWCASTVRQTTSHVERLTGTDGSDVRWRNNASAAKTSPAHFGRSAAAKSPSSRRNMPSASVEADPEYVVGRDLVFGVTTFSWEHLARARHANPERLES